jgi:hypothetical protein
MVMVLLCQGLVFEPDEDNDPAVAFFGAVIVLILCLSVLGSAFLLAKRKITANKRVQITKSALDLMSSDTMSALYQLYSSELSNHFGLLEMDKEKMKDTFPQEELKEVYDINSKAYKLGTEEYEQFAASSRALSLNATSRSLNVSMSPRASVY